MNFVRIPEQTDPQPGDRPPAPGQLAVVQAFLNTHFDLGPDWGQDVLRSPEALADWLSAHGLRGGGSEPSAQDLQQALLLRQAFRQVIADPRDVHTLNALAQNAPAAVSFATGEPRFVPPQNSGARGALGALAAVAAASMLDGTWSRLKLCPGSHCGWAFYDQSRNRSGRWCSMSVCGARTKARAHYARRRAGAQESP